MKYVKVNRWRLAYPWRDVKRVLVSTIKLFTLVRNSWYLMANDDFLPNQNITNLEISTLFWPKILAFDPTLPPTPETHAHPNPRPKPLFTPNPATNSTLPPPPGLQERGYQKSGFPVACRIFFRSQARPAPVMGSTSTARDVHSLRHTGCPC